MTGPAFLIAGTRSGCGKTTISLGLLAALTEKGLAVQPFKCGPDFIDPTLHQAVTGRLSRNLDLWMCGPDFVRRTFGQHSREADISVVEGVMGMFDGGPSSSAALARELGLPVVLVLDVRSAAESVAAVLKGFEDFDPGVAPVAVILNRIGSERHLALIRTAIDEHCGAEVIGYLPRSLDFEIPARHLGLHMGEEMPLKPEALARLAATVSRHVDLDRLVALASLAGEIRPAAGDALPRTAPLIRLGVARDKAFCFYYQDNLDLLEAAGAELVFFSPLEDDRLPENLDGLYLGGGYPELFAEALAANKGLRREIREWGEAGRVIYAECGGFMYLTKSLTDQAGQEHEMAGIFPVKSCMREKRAALGYREVRLKKPGILGSAGQRLRGHEFHYSDISAMPESIAQVYEGRGVKTSGYTYEKVLASYVHLHFGSTPEAVTHLVAACQGKRWV